MFVFSVKMSRKQLWAALLCVVAVVAVLLVVVVWPSGGAAAQTIAPPAGDDTQRVAFLRSLGYEVTPQALEVREVLIPDEFDEVFRKYNELQAAAGMDLEPYHGKRVKCWTYEVIGHPSGEEVRAHLYVYKDKIVGGDISSTALNGFMHGLTAMTQTG